MRDTILEKKDTVLTKLLDIDGLIYIVIVIVVFYLGGYFTDVNPFDTETGQTETKQTEITPQEIPFLIHNWANEKAEADNHIVYAISYSSQLQGAERICKESAEEIASAIDAVDALSYHAVLSRLYGDVFRARYGDGEKSDAEISCLDYLSDN